jgi:tetratricopeptide (TPR) repeat protein
MKTPPLHLCLALVAALALACGDKPAPPAEPAPLQASAPAPPQPEAPPRPVKRLSPAKRPPLAAPADLLKRPRTRLELPTTDFHAFKATLDDQREAALKLRDGSPKSPLAIHTYASHILDHAKMMGDLEGIDEGSRVAAEGLALAPEDLNLRLLRAQAHFSLHRWALAKADLEVVRQQRPTHPALSAMEAEFLWNQGDVEGARSLIEEEAQRSPSWESLARLANLKMALGDVEGADQEFARAETLYKNTAPIPLAWLYVQRGLLRLHSGRFEDAKLFYEAAVERAPGYPMAVEHLAEIEHLLGNKERAVTLYLQVIKDTDNPEFHDALAGVYDELGRADEAKASRDRARERNLALIKKFPAAMAGHGADFFLGEGEDHEVARKLLTQNAAERPNPDAWRALAEAQLATGKPKDAQATIQKALSSPVRRAELSWTAARVAKANGAPEAEVERLRQEALTLNPRIAALEGDL